MTSVFEPADREEDCPSTTDQAGADADDEYDREVGQRMNRAPHQQSIRAVRTWRRLLTLVALVALFAVFDRYRVGIVLDHA